VRLVLLLSLAAEGPSRLEASVLRTWGGIFLGATGALRSAAPGFDALYAINERGLDCAPRGEDPAPIDSLGRAVAKFCRMETGRSAAPAGKAELPGSRGPRPGAGRPAAPTALPQDGAGGVTRPGLL
jgi:hypothetical protein